MCGLTGFIDFVKNSNESILTNMVRQLNHRGPDDLGIKLWNHENLQIGFGHARLSIIDLSELGHQPMFDETGRYSIIFNGEIYNYIEIKKKLEKKGIEFQSNSDTEVVLKAFINMGVDAVHSFIGMFAFTIYDENINKIYFFRDRAGVKPLYYYWKNNLFLFGSELKSLHQHPDFKKSINPIALNNYLKLGYVPTPQCIFNNTYKLKQGHYLVFDLITKQIDEKKYWSAIDFYNKPKRNLNLEDALDELEPLVKSACDFRMVADVPVGVFLSGGYDSTLIAAILQNDSNKKLNTFTIGFQDKKYNEAHYAKETADYLGTNHTELYCSFNDIINIIDQLPTIYDEPFADSSALPTTLVSALASKSVKVALSADGGDELFAGYDKYLKFNTVYNKLNKIPYPISIVLGKTLNNILTSFFRKLSNIKFLENHISNFGNNNSLNFKTRSILKSKKFSECLIDYSKSIVDDDIDLILNKEYLDKSNNLESIYGKHLADESFNDNINQMLAFDYSTLMMDDFCVKVDRASMSQGLEAREPLLDHRLLEWAAGTTSDLKIKNGVQKHILRELTYKYVPKELIDRPKKGFEIPIKFWLRDYMTQELQKLFDKKFLEEQGIFNSEYVHTEYIKYLKNENVDFRQIWYIFVFQQWYKKWVN